MIILVGTVCLLVMLSLHKKMDTNNAYLSYSDTTTVNAICTLFILFSHGSQYIELQDSLLDYLYVKFQHFHNQWVVVPFLFFSGYGVMEQYQKKGKEYSCSFPRKRIGKTFLNFCIAIIFFAIYNLLTGTRYDILKYVLSMVGLESVGNSSWYMFCILSMYIVSYISIMNGDFNRTRILIKHIIGIAVYILLCITMKKEIHYYNTVFAYGAGVLFSWLNEKNRRIISSKYVMVSACLFIILSYKFRTHWIIMNISGVALMIVIIWFINHFLIKSSVLSFVGKHVFGIFILQRIPMMLVSKYSQIANIGILFIIVSLIFTIILCYIYEFISREIQKTINKGT